MTSNLIKITFYSSNRSISTIVTFKSVFELINVIFTVLKRYVFVIRVSGVITHLPLEVMTNQNRSG